MRERWSSAAGRAETVVLVAKALDARNNYMSPSFVSDPNALYAEMKQLGQSGYNSLSGRLLLDQSGDRLGFFDVMNLQVTNSRRLAESGGPSERAVAELNQVPTRFVRARSLAVPLSSSAVEYRSVGKWSPQSSDPPTIQGGGAVVFPGRTDAVPSDTADSPGSIAGIIVGVVLGLIIVFGGFMCWQRRHYAKKTRALKNELKKFQDTVVGVREVSESFDPRQDGNFKVNSDGPGNRDVETMANAIRSKLNIEGPIDAVAMTAVSVLGMDGDMFGDVTDGNYEPDYSKMITSAYNNIVGTVESQGNPGNVSPVLPPQLPSIARARWFWQEDEGNISRHNPADVKQPGHFVSYAGSVCAELD